MSKLYFRYSAMNSGKTTRVIQEAYNYEERGHMVVIMKPLVDEKGQDRIISRLGLERRADILIEPQSDVGQLLANWLLERTVSCVFVDEAQFLEPQQVDQLLRFTVEQRIPVITYGLRTDFQMRGFPGSTRLLEIAHHLEEIPNICGCGKKARYNGRKVNGQFVFSGQQVVIDNQQNVEYEALCASCYLGHRDQAD